MFCLLYKHTHEQVFDDITEIFDTFILPKIFQSRSEGQTSASEHFPSFSKNYLRLSKTTEKDLKMFRPCLHQNKFQYSLRHKRKILSERNIIAVCKVKITSLLCPIKIWCLAKSKIGPQCELVWDFSQIKVDTLWKNRSFIANIYTFCRIVVMNVE